MSQWSSVIHHNWWSSAFIDIVMGDRWNGQPFNKTTVSIDDDDDDDDDDDNDQNSDNDKKNNETKTTNNDNNISFQCFSTYFFNLFFQPMFSKVGFKSIKANMFRFKRLSLKWFHLNVS